MGRAKPVERRQDDFRSGIERVEERTIKMHIVVSPSPGDLEETCTTLLIVANYEFSSLSLVEVGEHECKCFQAPVTLFQVLVRV